MKLKVKHIDSDLTAIMNIWQMIAYIFRYAKMELFIVLLLVILGAIAILNLNYSSGKVSLKPTTDIDIKVKKEVKN